ncbi:EF-hand domain-containing protein [Rhizobium glycinendophyticum]|nr:EF-hand domain-containing protein [Rhizobium glycinendophyticum]
MKTRNLIPAVLSLSLFMPLAAEAQQEAFMAADKNGDTQLDSSEFKTFIDALAAAGKPMAVKIKGAGRYGMAFGRIDKDKDGILTPTELSALK